MFDTSSTTYKVLIYLTTVVSFICTILVPIFGALSSFNSGLFDRRQGNISNKYFLEITPSSYVFGTIWPIIFVWTIVGKIYLVVSLFLPVHKSPIKTNPAFTPLSYLVFDSLAFAAATAWYFAFDAESLGWSFALLLFAAINIYVAIGITLKQTAEIDENSSEKHKVTTWLVKILLQNGLCVYATWITCAATLGFTMLLVYVDSPNFVDPVGGAVNVVTGSTIGLAILLVLVLIYFVVENFLLEKYLRYMFTIYPVLILAFSGIVSKLQQEGSEQNFVFSSVFFGIALLTFVIRIVLSLYRYYKRKKSHGKTEKGIEI